MIQTVEAVVDRAGRVRLLGEVHVTGPRRALVTVLEEPAAVPGEAALLAAAAVPLDAPDGLLVASFARPGKLFTAHAGLMVRSVGVLTPAASARVLSAVVAVLQPPATP